MSHNYVTACFSVSFTTEKYIGDNYTFKGKIDEEYFYAGYGNVFDANAIREGYAIQNKPLGDYLLEVTHVVLDVISFIPGANVVASGINAGIYALQGDWKNAALSAAAMIPFEKLIGTGLKYGSKLFTAGEKGVTVIGEGMARVEAAAAKIPGANILNTMPKFTGTADQVTSQMMQYNRQWILNEMRSGRTILDIGRDATRTNPSIFYQMEQKMMKNYKLLNH